MAGTRHAADGPFPMSNVYSSLKPLHFADRLAVLAAGRLPAPVHVRIKPTNVCNHGCYFCAYRSDAVSLGDGMQVRDRIPAEKMQEIVEDLIAMQVKAVTFSGGGEPLIYPGFADTVTALGEAGIQVASLTNGSRLKGKVGDALATHATWVRVSIDGWDNASYSAYRDVADGEFDKVMANLAAFADRGSACVLGASIIVDERNAGHVAELCGKLKDAGVSHAKISPCIVSNDGAENNRYHAGFASVVHAQIAAARALDEDGFHVVNHYHDLPESFDKPYHGCPMAAMLTVIGADLTVYSCQDKAYTTGGALGSIADQRFAEFWYSPANARQQAACDPARDCRHHCVADAKNRLLNDYLALDPDHLTFV